MDKQNELEIAYDVEIENEKRVIKLRVQGKTPSEIETSTGIPPRVQREIFGRFESYANSDMVTQSRARTVVAEMDEHFESIKRDLYAIKDEAEIQQEYRLVKDILKDIANVEKMRVDALQKAGVLSAHGLGDEMAESDRKQRQIIELLKAIAKKHPEAARDIAEGIADLDRGDDGEVITVR